MLGWRIYLGVLIRHFRSGKNARIPFSRWHQARLQREGRILKIASEKREKERESQEGLLRSREKGRIAHVFTFNAFSSTVFLLSSFLMAKLTFNLKGPFIRLTKSEIQLYMKYLPGMPVEMGPGKMESFDVLSKNGKYKRSVINSILDVSRSCEQTRSASLDTYAYL